MKSIPVVIISFLLLALGDSAMGQLKNTTIRGRIISFEESLPLEGASIRVKGSDNKTGTQADGSFSLSVSPEEKVLVVSLPGYEKKEIPLTKTRDYEIVLKRANNIFKEADALSFGMIKLK